MDTSIAELARESPARLGVLVIRAEGGFLPRPERSPRPPRLSPSGSRRGARAVGRCSRGMGRSDRGGVGSSRGGVGSSRGGVRSSRGGVGSSPRRRQIFPRRRQIFPRRRQIFPRRRRDLPAASFRSSRGLVRSSRGGVRSSRRLVSDLPAASVRSSRGGVRSSRGGVRSSRGGVEDLPAATSDLPRRRRIFPRRRRIFRGARRIFRSGVRSSSGVGPSRGGVRFDREVEADEAAPTAPGKKMKNRHPPVSGNDSRWVPLSHRADDHGTHRMRRVGPGTPALHRGGIEAVEACRASVVASRRGTSPGRRSAQERRRKEDNDHEQGKTKSPVDQATATIKKGTRTDALKVSVTNGDQPGHAAEPQLERCDRRPDGRGGLGRRGRGDRRQRVGDRQSPAPSSAPPKPSSSGSGGTGWRRRGR